MSSFNPNFLIGSLKIGSIEGASCVNFGNNFPIGFESYKKQNQGFGNVTGDSNNPSDIKSMLQDTEPTNDFKEKIKNLNSDQIPDWVKELVLNELNDEEN